ncbi:unnamed protein product [Sphenostylis stenocarpa]|uniref:Uncharacterized protein n=1 Tax=Sphenostylis stenocarpa TaxID=92480 RepID=A0AA86S9I1_9FABA|nr:unnamed protein product [Sphenostylis stenocarpa]
MSHPLNPGTRAKEVCSTWKLIFKVKVGSKKKDGHVSMRVKTRRQGKQIVKALSPNGNLLRTEKSE